MGRAYGGRTVLRTGDEIQPLADAENRMLPHTTDAEENDGGAGCSQRAFALSGSTRSPLTSWSVTRTMFENIVRRFQRFIGCFCGEAAILDASDCTLHPGLSLKESASWDRME